MSQNKPQIEGFAADTRALIAAGVIIFVLVVITVILSFQVVNLTIRVRELEGNSDSINLFYDEVQRPVDAPEAE